jgi:hypothetical protein
VVNAVQPPRTPGTGTRGRDKHLHFYSESLHMNVPVSRVDCSDWYRALRVTSPQLDSEDLLATLLRNAAMEARWPDDPTYDMPWYERENYIAQAVITAGRVAPRFQPAPERDPENEPAGEQLYFRSRSGDVKYAVSQLGWSGWYATVTSVNPQLDDLHLLGELIHAASCVAQKSRYARTGTTPPPRSRHRYRRMDAGSLRKEPTQMSLVTWSPDLGHGSICPGARTQSGCRT